MITQHLFPRLGAGVAVVCLFLAIPHTAQATATSYTIDSSLSVLNLSGSFGGFAFSAQIPGALSDHFSGTISADSSGGVLTFSGGSAISAVINPAGLFQPLTAGAPGTAPGNFGVVIPAIGEFGAYRNLVFDVLAGTVMNGVVPGVTLSYAGGALDYAGPATGAGQLAFAGLIGPDGSALPASLTTAGGLERLVLPFTFSLSDPSGLQQTFDGTIVAFRPVPEPSPLVLALAGGAIFGAFCRFRHLWRKRG